MPTPIIDLTGQYSPPELPRPTIGNRAIAPRRRLRDGSTSTTSSALSLAQSSQGSPSGSGSSSGIAGMNTRAKKRDTEEGGFAAAAGGSGSGVRSASRTGRAAGNATTRGGARRNSSRTIADSSDEENNIGDRGAGARTTPARGRSRPAAGSTNNATRGRPAPPSHRSITTIPDDDEDDEDLKVISATTPTAGAKTRKRRPPIFAVPDSDEHVPGKRDASHDEDDELTMRPMKKVKVDKGKARATEEVVEPQEPEEHFLAAATCLICISPPLQAVVTPCGHIYCGACLFEALKHESIREGIRPNNVGEAPKGQRGSRRSKTKPKGRILTGSCPFCRETIDGGMSDYPGEGGVRYLEIRTVMEL